MVCKEIKGKTRKILLFSGKNEKLSFPLLFLELSRHKFQAKFKGYYEKIASKKTILLIA